MRILPVSFQDTSKKPGCQHRGECAAPDVAGLFAGKLGTEALRLQLKFVPPPPSNMGVLFFFLKSNVLQAIWIVTAMEWV